jgi:hypothetical protein
MMAKRSKAQQRKRRLNPQRRTSGQTKSDNEIQLPNEYFHTVVIHTVWHPNGGVPQDEVVDEEHGDLKGGAKHCMQGTGFFYRLDGRNYLVTARHCFTQRAWRTDDYLDPPVTPTHVRMRLRLKPKSETFDAAHLLSVEFCLRLVDEDQNPLWFEHPRGAQVDLAARPLDDLPIDELFFLPTEPNDAAYGTEPRFWVTDDVYIVGYPFGLDHGYYWPIWIRGTVASEPSLNFTYKEDEYPLFLVDSRTRSGQSGSPVYLQRRHFTEIPKSADVLPRSRLLGVYTGRINAESDLGLTWHIGEVERICRAELTARKSRS